MKQIRQHMPDFHTDGSFNKRKPKEMSGPDGAYPDTIDSYKPSDSGPSAFMESGRSSGGGDFCSPGSGGDSSSFLG